MIDTAKNILQTKTFWANLLGPLFLWLGAHYGLNLDADAQFVIIVILMSLANIILRRLTSTPVTILPKGN